MNSEPQRQFKKWEDLDITDDFIFSRVMRNKKLCRTLLEMILKVKIGKIIFLTSHHAIQIEPNTKGIIMDVYLKDENRVINVEHPNLSSTQSQKTSMTLTRNFKHSIIICRNIFSSGVLRGGSP